MLLKCVIDGALESNTYIVANSNAGFIIDAGADEKKILEVINEYKLKIEYIILTHGHVDHTENVDKIKEVTGARVIIGKDEKETYENPDYNLSNFIGFGQNIKTRPELVNDGDIIEIGDMKVNIISTPGHTRGGITVKINNWLFTGDTLFKMAIGRTDLKGGNYNQLVDSIKRKIMVFDDDFKIYPGHGESTTIGFERNNNHSLI